MARQAGKAAEPPTPDELRAEISSWLQSSDDASEFLGFRSADLEAEFAHMRGFQRLLSDKGWSRWGWPIEAGGLGGTAVLRGVMYDVLYASGFPVPESFIILEVIGPLIVAFAPALARAHLRALISGDELWAQGFSEPNSGSDLASLSTRAVEDGDSWRVTGQKVWTTLGHVSNRCVVLCRTGAAGHRGLSFLLVDLDAEGVLVRPIRAENGRNEFAEIFFDDVLVPRDRLIGEKDAGWQLAMYMLQWERGMYPWLRQGMLFSRLREVLARPRDDVGRFAETVGAAYLGILALRLRSRDTLHRLGKDENPGSDLSVDKVLLGTVEQEAFSAFRALLHPLLELGSGDDADVWRAEFLYSRAATIYGGSAEIQRTIIAQRVLGLPREP